MHHATFHDQKIILSMPFSCLQNKHHNEIENIFIWIGKVLSTDFTAEKIHIWLVRTNTVF